MATLATMGARFVLANEAKVPVARGYPDPHFLTRRWELADVLEWPHLLGVVPWSLGCSVLDVDEGDPAELIARHPPLCTVATQSGGVHLWYHDSRPRGSPNWRALGAAGQVRSANGYVVLWDRGAALSTALATTRERRSFPADLFEAAGVSAPPRRPGRPPPPPPRRPTAQGGGGERRVPRFVYSWTLKDAHVGERDERLYRMLCALVGMDCMAGALVEDLLPWAERWAATMPVPFGSLPGDEQPLAKALAAWRTHQRRDDASHRAHKEDVQRRKAKRLAAQRAGRPLMDGHRFAGAISVQEAGYRGGKASGASRRAQVWERDAAVRRDRAEGWSLRSLSTMHGLSLSGVGRILKNEHMSARGSLPNQGEGKRASRFLHDQRDLLT